MAFAGRRYYSGRDVGRAVTIADLQAMARRRLPAFVTEYLEGGAEDEWTLRRNREAFSEIEFRPSTLTGVGIPDLSTTIFGRKMRLPIIIAPTGFNGLFQYQGDRLLSEAAAKAGVTFTQSTVSNMRIEELSGVPDLSHWMQLYVFRSQAFMDELVGRAEKAGCRALMVTTDAATFGNREWDRRNYRSGMDPTFRHKLDILCHPRWALSVMARGIPPFGNLLDFLPADQQTFARTAIWSREQVEPDLHWTHIRRLRKIWKKPLIVKGVMTLRDAELAADAGADGIVISNHGGRQLDGAPSPITILPKIAGKLKGRITILADSGFRRGTDIVKALALGADAVMTGRAALYGLAAGGEAGAARAITILEEEIRRTMALLGCRSVADLDRDHIKF
ncbi:L-lactate dehydrogenase (cytochrome) [Neorhizobium galegae bv. officinalis bv. officinalis str. HAMBI 1141]|uniref:L-lactate dehydrogenase (Cytochrome) n=1 Tax=Neorhizobium galegae bv. officinalis bv. officinalis str. HAMBI 1141 TaxID=1028801 RepID=A0A068TFG8_NEOGA|nr:alpha-hydroxy acid oxidase [Neorhizobium galegae]CDN56140.1 L-lactate dehydrogenase (cytochrome) [Neorhizobium galegae bv. officinalis bv. officinalis str. HAMBI 1141]